MNIIEIVNSIHECRTYNNIYAVCNILYINYYRSILWYLWNIPTLFILV